MDNLINGFSNYVNALHDYVVKIEYSCTQPLSFIVLVPIIAQVVQAVQLHSVAKPRNILETNEYEQKVDRINKCHLLGALTRTMVWVALAVLTGNIIFSLCAVAAWGHVMYSSAKLEHKYSIVNGNFEYCY